MQIDPQLSEFSDLAFRSAESLYLLALAVSLVFYGMVRMGADRRRQRAEELEKLQAEHSAHAASTAKVAVGAGAAGDATDSDVADAGEVTGEDIEPDFASFEAQLPERLRSESVSKTLDRSNKLGGITQSLVWLAIAIHDPAWPGRQPFPVGQPLRIRRRGDPVRHGRRRAHDPP